MRGVDGDRDGSGSGDGFLQLVLIVLLDIDKSDISGTNVLLAESEIF